MSAYVGRFAPSPTGPLHLGSLATALGSWLDAQVHQGRWLVRIEDIDPERCKPEHTTAILQALHAHGLHPDEPIWTQSQRHDVYDHTLEPLLHAGAVYPCACTRKELDAANQHRAFGDNRVYPGTCRHGMPKGRTARALRLRVPETPVVWTDWRLGPQAEDLNHTSGDFVLKRGDGHWAYHWVVVVDDALAGVTDVVRGEDLTDTTGRQVAVYRAMGWPEPRYFHLPVILAEDGQKLSKQTGAQALDCQRPLDNLAHVWSHFGMPALGAGLSLTGWLQQAVPIWANYRAAHRHPAV